MSEHKKTENKEQAADPSNCTDNNCPIHGKISLRGRTFEGRVLKNVFQKTATVEWERRKFVKKYERYEKKRTRVKAHVSTCIEVKQGDNVRIVESRPLSKTKNFVITQKM